MCGHCNPGDTALILGASLSWVRMHTVFDHEGSLSWRNVAEAATEGAPCARHTEGSIARQRESLAQLQEEVTKQAKPFADQRDESARLEKVTDRAPGVPGLFSDPQYLAFHFFVTLATLLTTRKCVGARRLCQFQRRMLSFVSFRQSSP